MELDPRRLRVLRAVALRGGVVDAARLLHLTPSAVSQQLAQLEREVGLALVDRSGRRVTLTEPGRILAARAERIEQELAEAQRELAALTGEVTGSSTLASFATAITHLVVPALREVASRHPGLRTSVVDLEGPEALHELRTGTIDVVITEDDEGLRTEPSADDGLASRLLLLEEYRIVVPAEWSQSVASIADLAERPWVAGPPGSACGEALERVAQQHGFAPIRAHVVVEYPAVISLVAAGFGAAILPTLALGGKRFDTGEFRPEGPGGIDVLPVPVPGRRHLMAVFRSSRTGPAARTEVLVEALAEAARPYGRTAKGHESSNA